MKFALKLKAASAVMALLMFSGAGALGAETGSNEIPAPVQRIYTDGEYIRKPTIATFTDLKGEPITGIIVRSWGDGNFEESQVVNGRKDGRERSFVSGNLVGEKTYKEGVFHGYVRYFDPATSEIEEEYYIMGVKTAPPLKSPQTTDTTKNSQ